MPQILLVEARQESRELDRIVLESIGLHVIETSTGREALAIALRENPDLVLLELQLADWDGFTALAEFRKTPKLVSIPIMAITACYRNGEKLRAIQAGFCGYLLKPVVPEELRRAIRRCLQTDRC